MAVFTPQVPESEKIVLGEGVIYKSYQSATPVAFGATDGGSTLEIKRTFQDIKYDGMYGKTKGLKRLVEFDASLKVNHMELDADSMCDYFAGLTTTDETTYDEIIQSVDPDDITYLDDIAFVGMTLAGKTVAIILENAVGDDKISMAFKTKDNLVTESVYSAHFDPTTPTVVPLKIWIFK